MKIRASLDRRRNPTGEKVSHAEFARIKLTRADFTATGTIAIQPCSLATLVSAQLLKYRHPRPPESVSEPPPSAGSDANREGYRLLARGRLAARNAAPRTPGFPRQDPAHLNPACDITVP